MFKKVTHVIIVLMMLLSAIGFNGFFILDAVKADPLEEINAVITILDSTSTRMAPHTVHVYVTDSDLAGGAWEKAKFEWDFGDPNSGYFDSGKPRAIEPISLSSTENFLLKGIKLDTIHEMDSDHNSIRIIEVG